MSNIVLLRETGDFIGSQYSNPNLLDNWYFPDPINQRGQTEYDVNSGQSYCIDRWLFHGDVFTLSGDGLSFSRSGDYIFQRLEPKVRGALHGKQITLSVLTDRGLSSGTITYISDASSAISVFKDLYVRCEINSQHNPVFYNLDNSCRFIAAKLELGGRQTLARQENGEWVLNDPPPNYQQELVKCQRYYRLVNLACISVANSATEVTLYAARPADMRIAAPTFADVTRAMTKTPIPLDTTTVDNIKITHNINYMYAVVSGLNSQVEGTVGFGYIKGTWNAEL